MKKVTIGFVTSLAITTSVGFVASSNIADAGLTCYASACNAARKAASTPPNKGSWKPTTEEMACANIYSIKPMTEVVWIDGPTVNGRVITTQRRGANSSVKFASVGGNTIYKTESCIKARLIKDLGAVTVCNGIKKGDGAHSVLRTAEIRKAVSGRRLEVSLLGKKLTAQVEAELN